MTLSDRLPPAGNVGRLRSIPTDRDGCRRQRSPKVASGPIVLALTDMATLFDYLGLATVLLAERHA